MSSDAVHLYVAPIGGHGADGSKERPFGSLEEARGALRQDSRFQGKDRLGAVVILRGGRYELSEPFELTAEDSGTADAPVVYRSQEGETAVLSGGRVVRGFEPVGRQLGARLKPNIREHVVAVDLKALGIDAYGELTPRGMGRPGYSAGLELFFNGQPMTLAQYPNDGWLRLESPQEDRFSCRDARMETWRLRDVWVHGYWTHDWADSYERVASIQDGVIETEPPHGVYGYKAGQRFRFVNVLEELDAPGEWHLDRETGVLCFYPPSDIEAGTAVVSIADRVLSMKEASHVRFERIAFEASRGAAVRIEGGEGCGLYGCVIRNAGTDGAVVTGGKEHSIVSCDVYETGDSGLRVSGGDRATLTPARHNVENCHIRRFSRWRRTYCPAVGVGGVGNRLAHCRIHDAPHAGVLFGGNDHVLEYNELYDLCLETGDVGGFYTGRDWTGRGTIIRCNLLRDIAGMGSHRANAVYLDDAASGIAIVGNIFARVTKAAFIGGGRDNRVENNIFVDCEVAVHIDARGLGWAKSHISVGGVWNMYEKLRAMNYQEPPYLTRYPALVHVAEDEPATPKGNVVRRNLTYNCVRDEIAPEAASHTVMEDNYAEARDPLFVNADENDYALLPESPVWAVGFEPIPTHRIGLVLDGLRRTLPPR